MKNKLLFTCCFMFSLSIVAQQQPQEFSLNEAIAYALENNYNAINANRDIEAAKKQKWETTTMGLPQIDASIDYQNFLKQPVSLVPAQFFGGEPGEFAEVVFGTKQNVNATATLKQLIFDGSYLVGLQSAKVFLEISKNAKEKTNLEVRKAVINAYGNVLLAKESVTILEKNKATLQKNLFETKKLYENGLTEEENVEQLQITLMATENSLNNAKRMHTIAKKLFNLTLGIDVDIPVKLTDELSALALKNIDSTLLSATEDVTENIDYKIAENNKRSKELLVKLEKSKALPTLNAFINGGYTGNSNEFNFFDSEQQWFGSSLVGVSLNIPIFSSLGRTAKTQRAKINLEKAKTELTQKEQELKMQIAAAKSDYKFAIEQFTTAQQNLALAERIEQKNQTKYFEGIATSFDLRQAQTQLYNSQQEYLQSMLNLITKKAELETLLNTVPLN